MLSFVERNQKLKARALVDDRPKNERSPSPQPIYDDSGVKINAREARLRAKLIEQRQKIIDTTLAAKVKQLVRENEPYEETDRPYPAYHA